MESDDIMVTPHGARLQRSVHERKEKTPDGKDIIKREVRWTPVSKSKKEDANQNISPKEKIKVSPRKKE